MDKEYRDDDEIEVDLLELFHVVMRKMWIIIASMLIGALIMGVYTKVMVTPLYKATSTIYILGNKSENNVEMSDLQVGSQLTKDYQELIKKRSVLEPVINKLNLDMSYEGLKSSVSISNAQDTRLVEISVTNPSPELASKIADEIALTTIDKVAEVMKTDKPSLVEKAFVPTSPVSPSLPKNVILGALLMAILVVGVIVVKYLLDDTIKNEEDVKKYLGLNTLASLPDTKEAKRIKR